MKIDAYLNKMFSFHENGKKHHIEKFLHVSGDAAYIIVDEYGEYTAQIHEFDEVEFRWFTYILNLPRITGSIKFSELEQHLITN